MKIGALTPADIAKSSLSEGQRQEILAELGKAGVKPTDLGPDHLARAGVPAAEIPGLLFQLRVASLPSEEAARLRGVEDALAALEKTGRWSEAGPSGNLTYDHRVQSTAEALAKIVTDAERAGTIAALGKAEVDGLVAALLEVRQPDAYMAARVPDLSLLREPRIGELTSSGMGTRITLRDGKSAEDFLTLYTFAGGAYLEAGTASGTFSPGGMVSLGYLDFPKVEQLVAILDKALQADARGGAPRSAGKHPALAAASAAHTKRGFLLEMKRRLLGQGEARIQVEKANADAIRALEPRLVSGPAGTWFAAERMEVPSRCLVGYGPGYVSDYSTYGGNHKMIIPAGAELWAEGGRHPGELIRDRALPGLWIRHEGRCYCVDGEGFPSPRSPAHFGQYSHMGRYHASEPAGFPAHWKDEAKPAAEPRVYPRNAAHGIISAGLRTLADPAVSTVDDGAGRTLIVSARGAKAQDGIPLGALRIHEDRSGKLSLAGWRLESTPIAGHDHETLRGLEELAARVRTASERAGDPAGAALAGRLRTAAHTARAALEASPTMPRMRELVAAGFDYSAAHLEALIARGVGAAELAAVHDTARSSSNVADPEAFARRVAELVWPDRVVVGRTEAAAVIDAALRGDQAYLAADAAIAKILAGGLSGADRADLSERIAGWEKTKDWPALSFRAALARGLLDGGEAAKELFTNGKAASASDYRNTLVRSWASMAGGARTDEERRRAFEAIAPHLSTTYFDMGGAVLPAAAVVADAAQRADVSKRADEELDSKYWAFASGALLAKALCARTGEERDQVFERAKKELEGNNLRIGICALNALGLVAHTPEQRAETLRLAREYAVGNWKLPLRGAGLLAMAMVESSDDAAKRAASMANLDL